MLACTQEYMYIKGLQTKHTKIYGITIYGFVLLLSVGIGHLFLIPELFEISPSLHSYVYTTKPLQDSQIKIKVIYHK